MLALTAVIAIVLGLGLPTVGVYIIMATLVAPALVKIGIAPDGGAHVLLYFGVMSMVTPPVALSAFAAANIAGSDVDKTGWTATRIGWAAYIVPFLCSHSRRACWTMQDYAYADRMGGREQPGRFQHLAQAAPIGIISVYSRLHGRARTASSFCRAC